MFSKDHLRTIKSILDNRETEYPKEYDSTKKVIEAIYKIIDMNLRKV